MRVTSIVALSGLMLVFGTVVVPDAASATGAFNVPTGLKFNPHVAEPALKIKPVINRSPRHVQRLAVSIRKYTAITKTRARRQGNVSAGGTRWNCKGNRCTTNVAWARPTVQTCKALAGVVGAIQSYGKSGVTLNAVDIRSCNAGIAVVKSNRRTRKIFNKHFNQAVSGVAGSPPVLPGTTAPRVRGGFAPGATGASSLRTLPAGNRGFAPKLTLPTTTNNIHTLSKRNFKNRSGGRFVPSSPARTKIQNPNIADADRAGKSFKDKIFTRPIQSAMQAPDTVTTGQLSLIGNPPAPLPPDIVDTGQLSLIGKPQAPDTVYTGQLSLISKILLPDVVPTGPLILMGRGH